MKPNPSVLNLLVLQMTPVCILERFSGEGVSVRCLLDGCQVCVNKTLQTTKLVRGLQSCPSCFVSLEPFSAMPSFPSYLSGSSAVWGHLTCGKLATFLFLPRWKFLVQAVSNYLYITHAHSHAYTHTHTHAGDVPGNCRGSRF
jgi:hypothetical protein